MEPLFIIFGVIAVLIALVFLTAFICFAKIFWFPRRKPVTDEIKIPEGKIYEPHRENMVSWIKQVRAMPHTEVSITSFDGLKLYGRYFEHKKGAPIELMFHGYRGNSERDMSGGVLRAAKLGRSALIVDHRASGKSEGSVTTFGVKESRDCISWIDFIINNIDKDAKIILTGISMGAATVMSVADKELPKNVVGILADCGYSTTEAIIKKVMRDMRLPSGIFYPFVRLGALLFGGFDPNAASAAIAVKNTDIPILLIHGTGDGFVPCEMSDEIAENGKTVTYLKVKDATHGFSYLYDYGAYVGALDKFIKEHIGESK